MPNPDPEAASRLTAEAVRLAVGGETGLAYQKARQGLELGLPASDLAPMAMVLRLGGDLDAERAVLAAAVATEPGNAEYLGLYALSFLRTGDETQAERLLEQVLVLKPDDNMAVGLLARFRLRRGEVAAAWQIWDTAFAARPGDGLLRLRAARIFAHAGATEQAATCIALARPIYTGSPGLFTQSEALVRGEVPRALSRDELTELFNEFSERYDMALAFMGNNGPQALAGVLEKLGLAKDTSRWVLDAGCGTGLCARHLRPYARFLHGVDLAPAMLDKCRAKAEYDLLTRSDNTEAATLPEGPFDLIACGDVFVYLGDLSLAMANLGGRLAPGGHLVFTVEAAADGLKPPGYEMDVSVRFRHSRSYLETTLVTHGFARPEVFMEIPFREESGTYVKGYVVAARLAGRKPRGRRR